MYLIFMYISDVAADSILIYLNGYVYIVLYI